MDTCMSPPTGGAWVSWVSGHHAKYPARSVRAELGQISLARPLCFNCYPLGFANSHYYEALFSASLAMLHNKLRPFKQLVIRENLDVARVASEQFQRALFGVAFAVIGGFIQLGRPEWTVGR